MGCLSEKLTVLIIEDFDKFAEFLKEKFSGPFYVIALLDPDALINPQTSYINDNYIDKIKPDIIIMDLFIHSRYLEHKSGIECGIELIGKLRLNPKTRDIPIAILSKYGDWVHPSEFPSERKEYYRKHGMKFGPGKKYEWNELERFEKVLVEELNIKRNMIFNKFNYDERGYEELREKLYEMFQGRIAKNR